jgi:predicted permease
VTPVKWSERVYRRLLRLYPRDFRDEYGDEMSLLFRERERDGHIRLWLQVLGDLIFHAPKEHWSVLKQDVRYALRTFLRAPTFTVTVVATLALGIGANSVIFSAADAVLFRGAPVSDPDTLVEVYTSSGSNPHSSSSYPDYFDLRDSGTFASLAAYTPISMTLDAKGVLQPLAAEIVSGNYFDVLGVDIPFGRGFTPEDDRIGAPARVAVISHGLWQRVFDADRSLIGQTIRLNSNAYTLLGVAAPGFGGSVLGIAADVWVPIALQPEVDPVAASVRRVRGHGGKLDLRRSRGLTMVGRLPSGVSIELASARAGVISGRLESEYPDSNRNRRFNLVQLGEGARGLRAATRPILRPLAGAVLMVLLVACVNVASLLLARTVSREREVAVRISMGASHARLVRQWLTESVLLGILGATGAVLVAYVSTPLLHAFVIPPSVDLSVNARVLAFTLVFGVGSGLIFGLAPVFHVFKCDTTASLRDRGAVATGTRATWMRGAFVVFQIAVSLVLLVGAGLFVRTLENAYSVDLSYQLDQTLVASLDLEARGYFEGGARGADAGLAVYEQILSRVEALPGVVSAAAARMTVLSGGARSTGVTRGDRPLDSNNVGVGVRANVVSHRYFETMNVTILRGRVFNASDSAKTPLVTIVNKRLADRLWPGEDPIGKTVRDEDKRILTVIGVVPDTVYTTTMEQERPPTFYLLLAQNYESGVALHVRAAGDPMALVPAIRDAVRQADSQIVVERPQLLRDVLDRTLNQQRMMATLVGLFGVVALILAVFGLYGVMAHAATQRTPEIGIRLAMGAQPTSIVRLLLGQAVRLIGIGAAIGLAGALLVTRYIEAQLFGVTATDPLTFISGCVVLAIAGVAASVIPALRAMHVDPVVALRAT